MYDNGEPQQSEWIAEGTRRYGRSKGLTLIAQGTVFTAGVLPLVYTVRSGPELSSLSGSGLWLMAGAVFLFSVWIGLKIVPRYIDIIYYSKLGNVVVGEPETPDWARFVAPLCIFGPIGICGLGLIDGWQATVLSLTLFGLYMYGVGKFCLREPATELIGATTVLLGGLVAAVPGLVVSVGDVPVRPEVVHVLNAQGATISITGWLFVGWLISAIGVHWYSRWLLSELKRETEGVENE